MSRSLNKCLLIGRLGSEPEQRYTASQVPVTNFTLATNETWTDKDGKKQERTEWHKIVIWGKLGELCHQYLSKGRMCFVEGRIQTREWEDKQGNKRYTTEVVAKDVQFLDGQGNTEKVPEAAQSSDIDDDIPF